MHCHSTRCLRSRRRRLPGRCRHGHSYRSGNWSSSTPNPWSNSAPARRSLGLQGWSSRHPLHRFRCSTRHRPGSSLPGPDNGPLHNAGMGHTHSSSIALETCTRLLRHDRTWPAGRGIRRSCPSSRGCRRPGRIPRPPHRRLPLHPNRRHRPSPPSHLLTRPLQNPPGNRRLLPPQARCRHFQPRRRGSSNRRSHIPWRRGRNTLRPGRYGSHAWSAPVRPGTVPRKGRGATGGSLRFG